MLTPTVVLISFAQVSTFYPRIQLGFQRGENPMVPGPTSAETTKERAEQAP